MLSAAIPMKVTAACTIVAVLPGGASKVVVDPSPAEMVKARSLHVVGFTSGEDLLLAESEERMCAIEEAKTGQFRVQYAMRLRCLT